MASESPIDTADIAIAPATAHLKRERYLLIDPKA
jgi:hypothetical protein